MHLQASSSVQSNTSRLTRRYVGLAVILVTGIMLFSASGIASASSNSVTSNSKSDIDLFVFVPCAEGGSGESVHLTGSIHDLFHVTDNGKGGFVVKFHDNPQGVVGIGEESGDTYHGTGATQGTLVVKSGTSETSINNFRIIGQGPDNNFAVHSNMHIRVNQDGTISSFHDNFRVTCK